MNVADALESRIFQDGELIVKQVNLVACTINFDIIIFFVSGY